MEKRTAKEILEELASGLRGVLFENGSTLSFQLGMKKFYVEGSDQYDRLLNMILVDCLIANSEEDLKRVYVTQDDDGIWYCMPYDLKEYFHALHDSFGLPQNISSEMIEHLENKRQAMDEAFDKEFSQYATGGDINLIEVYARI